MNETLVTLTAIGSVYLGVALYGWWLSKGAA